MIQHHDGRDPVDGTEGPDPILTRSLSALDPVRWDPTYWFRFRDRVVSAAARELARRRMIADTTMSELVASWARTLVPGAILAAALAAFLLVRSREPSILPLAVEEILAEGIDGASIPNVLTSEDQLALGGARFASEAY